MMDVQQTGRRTRPPDQVIFMLRVPDIAVYRPFGHNAQSPFKRVKSIASTHLLALGHAQERPTCYFFAEISDLSQQRNDLRLFSRTWVKRCDVRSVVKAV